MVQNYDELLGETERLIHVNRARGVIDGLAAAVRTLQAERDAAYNQAIEDAKLCCTQQLGNSGWLLSNPPQSAAAWDARNAIEKLKRPTP